MWYVMLYRRANVYTNTYQHVLNQQSFECTSTHHHELPSIGCEPICPQMKSLSDSFKHCCSCMVDLCFPLFGNSSCLGSGFRLWLSTKAGHGCNHDTCTGTDVVCDCLQRALGLGTQQPFKAFEDVQILQGQLGLVIASSSSHQPCKLQLQSCSPIDMFLHATLR